jgi:hypothetical protein
MVLEARRLLAAALGRGAVQWSEARSRAQRLHEIVMGRRNGDSLCFNAKAGDKGGRWRRTWQGVLWPAALSTQWRAITEPPRRSRVRVRAVGRHAAMGRRGPMAHGPYPFKNFQ